MRLTSAACFDPMSEMTPMLRQRSLSPTLDSEGFPTIRTTSSTMTSASRRLILSPVLLPSGT